MLKHMPGVALTWLGIVGAAITLFVGLLAPLDMADWAWWLVQNWQDATPLAWDRLGVWLGAEVPAALVPSLTMSVFLLLTGAGAGLSERRHRRLSVVRYPILQLTAAIIALSVMAHVLLANSTLSSTASSVPADAPLAIFLAGAAISFSPMIAGGGNLTKRLWFVLAGLVILLVLNESTKLALDIMAPKDSG